jgi:hypothetical protein
LFRFINDSHAATADFTADAVVAKDSREMLRTARWGLAGAFRRGGAAQVRQHRHRREKAAQRIGVFGMPLDIGLDIGRFAGLDPVGEFLDQIGDNRINLTAVMDGAGRDHH